VTSIYCQRPLQKHVNSQTDIAPVSTCPVRDLFFFWFPRRPIGPNNATRIFDSSFYVHRVVFEVLLID